MKFRTTWARRMAVGALFLSAAGVCSAQRGFPLKPGEWKVSTKAEGSATPIEILLCLNDETWTKAFSRGSMCKIQDFSATSKGFHYTMDCSAPTTQFKGPVDLVFDGMEHMAGKATLQVTAQGKTATSTSAIDYRWKAAACSSADVNMRSKAGK